MSDSNQPGAAHSRTLRFPEGLTRNAYLLVVLVPLLLPLGYALRTKTGMSVLFAWVPVLTLFGALPVVDVLLGRDRRNPDPRGAGTYPDVIVPLLAAGVQLAVLTWGIASVRGAWGRWPALAIVGFVLSLGVLGGVVSINVAHELIHRQRRGLRALGGVLLSSVLYPGFKIEHVRGHHAKVATPEDPASAPRGSTVYSQVPRALVLNTARAFSLARRVAEDRGRKLPWLLHELSLLWAVALGFALGAYLLAGPLGLAVFVAQGLVAASLLEVINYIEHYGLRRKELAPSVYERPSLHHAWNTDYWLSSVILLQLERHADHHVHASRPFSGLQTVDEAPQLPLGYAAMSLIALVPPLFHRLVHPRLPQR